MNSFPHPHTLRIKISPWGVTTFLTGRRFGKNGLFVGTKPETNPASEGIARYERVDRFEV
jgi:hypothetical protein